jgi:hypothetical protein
VTIARWGPFVFGTVPAYDDPIWLNRVETSYASSKTVTGASFTPSLADGGGHVLMSRSSAQTVTIPANVFEEGMVIVFRQIGTGVLTVTPGAGMTMHPSSSVTVTAQWRPLCVTFLSASECVVD